MTERRKILFVEDEPGLQKITRIILEKVGGFEVVACNNGLAALQALETFQPDVILLDVQMPEMDGPTTLAELRKTDGGQDIPVFFTTGNVKEEARRKYLEMGACDVIDKPYDPKALCGMLKDFLGS
jgi:two-component system, OmpR family, response regulator